MPLEPTTPQMLALIVDDDPMWQLIVEKILRQMGYAVLTAGNGKEAIEYLKNPAVHLVITDWDMPAMSGIELCRAIRAGDYAGYVYVIMMTGNDTDEQKLQGLSAGADAFLTKPFKPAELLVSVKTAERILALETSELAIFALARLAESRDSETGKHIERVQKYARILAQQLGKTEKYGGVADESFVRLVVQTSPLHDIGKVGIPDAILLKPGKLDAREMAIMRTHSKIGAETLDAALERFPHARFLRMARDIAAGHHERWDGKGYPDGVSGEAIPLAARIVALADVYDALTSRRVYKPAMTHETARGILLAERGKQFDPDVVEAFVAREGEFAATCAALADYEEGHSGVASPLPVAGPSLEAGVAACRQAVEELRVMVEGAAVCHGTISTPSNCSK